MGKLTPKQEAFCRAYVEAGSASEAYRQAYPKARAWKPETVHKRASELLAHREVMGRVEALQAAARERHEITLDSLTSQAQSAYALARDKGRPGDMIRAIDTLARLHGLNQPTKIAPTSPDGSEEYQGGGMAALLRAAEQAVSGRKEV